MKIGILGGTFDPIHKGHIQMGKNALIDLNLDKVVFMVAGISAHKDRKITSDIDRVNMVKLAIKDEPRFSISLYEIEKKEKSYSYDTMVYLKENYPEDDFYFIVGGDSILNIEKWYRYEDLLKITKFLCYKRPDYDNLELEKKVKKLNSMGYEIILKKGDFLDISSSEIRKRVRNGQKIDDLTFSEVEKYIIDKRLYIV
mgnify:CR=1 FL=1